MSIGITLSLHRLMVDKQSTEQTTEQVKETLGDIFFVFQKLMLDYGLTLEEVLEYNMAKHKEPVA